MPRKRISEFKAKDILSATLNIPFTGITFDFNKNSLSDLSLSDSKKYVVKVDQGIKKRFKQGLVGLDLNTSDVKKKIEEFNKEGYSKFIIEEFISDANAKDYFLSVQRVRGGLEFYYSDKGGVDIEEKKDDIRKKIVKNEADLLDMKIFFGLEDGFFEKIIEAFENNYFSFLEINPLRVINGRVYLLDCAVEVDDAAVFFINNSWTNEDFVEFKQSFLTDKKRKETEEEINIDKLSEESSSSFSLEVLNPNGSIFLLLSGGGGSIVLADEVYLEGDVNLIANYGEYSGNPSEEETYLYTKNLLSLLLKSAAPRKALIIGGGVANFTDVRVTFKGIIHALSEVSKKLKEQGVKIFVRRGGPHDVEGLSAMRGFLKDNDLFGEVFGAEIPLTDIVRPALDYVS